MLRVTLLALAAAALSSCTAEEAQSCPGEVVATFRFTQPPDQQLDPEFDPDPELSDCFDPLVVSTLPPFDASLAADAGGSAGALCRSGGTILFGTRTDTPTGTRWVVENASDGAVLGACAPTCAARSRVVISGELVAVPTPSFRGGLVEQLSQIGGDCGACVLPCAARYALTGTAEAP